MSRRDYTIRLVCAHEGCRETTFTVADTRREEAEVRARYRANPYRCYRHSKPNEVLSAANSELSAVVTAQPREGLPGRMFWDGGSGLISGPGFRAIADDFPPGTRLIVTARIELPEGGAA